MTITKQGKLGFGETKKGGALSQGSSQGVLQPSITPAAIQAAPPIQVSRWARNGKHPNAILESMKGAGLNSAVLFKCKEVFRNAGWFQATFILQGMTSGSGVSPRWRSYFHTGPYTQFVDVEVVLRVESSDSLYGFANPNTAFGQVDITDVALATTVTETFPTGGQGNIPALLENTKPVTKRLAVRPNADYSMVFTEHGSYMVCANVHEVIGMNALLGGCFPQNIVSGGPILDAYRQNEAGVLRNIWQNSGWQIFNWSCDQDACPVTTTSTTYTNLLDAVVSQVDSSGTTSLGSTTVSQNSPGFIVDTRGRGRRTEVTSGAPGIPCVINFYGSTALGQQFNWQLLDSTGAVVASDTSAFTNINAWYQFNFRLPANAYQKYDIQIASSNGATVKVYAVSIYELG